MTRELAQQLTEHRQDARQGLPARSLAILRAEVAGLAASGITDHALRTGSVAPGFTLPDTSGRQIALGDLVDAGPVVLTFFHGEWSPYCALELRAWESRLSDVIALGASLLAISPQPLAASRETVEKLGLTFPVLSDAGNAVARAYRLAFTVPEGLRDLYAEQGIDLSALTGDPSYTLPFPATYVIDSDGTIAWSYVNADHTLRAEPEDALEVLARLARKHGHKERSRRSLFHHSRVEQAS
ncbi:MAG TPA: peroxiredoxin-like family protein [Propionibacteriaceae bacterium]|nr:peroxiredoxin-like family protein [Propionibacteriaceae bacterium]